MKTYTASNGIEVSSETQPFTGDRRLRFCGPQESGTIEISARNMRALIETLDAERDEELGRWRWPENPDLVVYADEGGDVEVLDERRGTVSSLITRDDVSVRNPSHPATKAAIAYFAAHPERKPWHDAKPGEVWVVTEGDLSETYPYLVDDEQFYDSARDYALNFTDPAITAARRIWPEES